MCYLFLTHPGLEEFTARELKDYQCSIISPGLIEAQGKIDHEKIFSLRTILHAKKFLGFLNFSAKDSNFENLYQQLTAFDYSFVDQIFRVSVKRHFTGALSFKMVDLERALVSFIEEKYGASFSLRSYKINIRIDLYPDQANLGIALNEQEVCKRFIKPYNFSNAIKGNIASAMCMLAQINGRENSLVVDLFCGSAMLAMEALDCFPQIDLVAVDRNDNAIIGASQNLLANHSGKKWRVLQVDALELSNYLKNVSVILADPPFGRHMGKKIKFSRFYGYLLSEVRKVLVIGGRFVIRIVKKDSFLKVAQEIKGLDIEHIVVIDQGGFYSYLISLVRI